MEDLIPPILSAIREIRWHLSAGRSMKAAFSLYIEAAQGELARVLRDWWTLKLQGGDTGALTREFKSHYQLALLEIVERGCKGEPTLAALEALESEVERASLAELELHVASLPFKVLIPLLLFQFPAYLLLLLMPLLRDLSRQLGG